MRTRLLLALVAASLLALVGPGLPQASAAPRTQPLALDVSGWRFAGPGLPGPNAADGIGPGSYLLITQRGDDGSGNPPQFICTANFVWDGAGGPYLGAAGHCFLPADKEAAVGSDPYVLAVDVCVRGCAFGGQLGNGFAGTFKRLGEVVYARQVRNGVDVGNDFGLVRIPASLTPLIRPRVPVWGGPRGSAPVSLGTPVCVYGNGEAVGEVFATKARTGVGVDEADGAWYADIPSLPGDSGSAVVNCPGLTGTTALGALTHLVVGTGVVAGTTVQRAVSMVRSDLGLDIKLRNG